MKLKTTFFAGIAALAMAAPAAVSAQDLRAGVAEDMPGLMELYRDLHANPELSFEEHKTAAKLAKRMRDLGFEVTEGVGRTGVVSVMRNGDGPTVLLRADMDGLPVVEQTGLPFASKVVATPASGVTTGVMHACGHDTHMAGFIGAAQQLVDHKDQWQGTLVMVLQPAEELGLGALAMLVDGLYTRFPKPDYALAFHDAAAPAPAGTIGFTPGYALANVDSVDITVKGVGGHGAYPHTTVDPIVLASNMVMQFQTIVSRNSSPLDPAVITVGSFHSGAKHNIIPDEVKLQLTVRSYSDASRDGLLKGIERIARHLIEHPISFDRCRRDRRVFCGEVEEREVCLGGKPGGVAKVRGHAKAELDDLPDITVVLSDARRIEEDAPALFDSAKA